MSLTEFLENINSQLSTVRQTRNGRIKLFLDSGIQASCPSDLISPAPSPQDGKGAFKASGSHLLPSVFMQPELFFNCWNYNEDVQSVDNLILIRTSIHNAGIAMGGGRRGEEIDMKQQLTFGAEMMWAYPTWVSYYRNDTSMIWRWGQSSPEPLNQPPFSAALGSSQICYKKIESWDEILT